MDFGVIIFVIYVVISIVSAINKNKNKGKPEFPDRPTEDEGKPGVSEFEELIRQAQEKARKKRIQKENTGSHPRTIEATQEQRRPAFEERPQHPESRPVFADEPLPDRRVLVDEDPYRPNIEPTRTQQIEKPRMLERPKVTMAKQLTPLQEYEIQRKRELTVTKNVIKTAYQRIKPPEEDFFKQNALGDKAKSQRKSKKQKGIKKTKSRTKKMLGKEFVFNGRDAIIYSEVMDRRF